MRTVFRHLSIGRRLALAFGLLTLLLIVIAAAGVNTAVNQKRLSEETHALQKLRDQIAFLSYSNADISGWQGYIYADAMVSGPAEAVKPTAYNMEGIAESRDAVYAQLDAMDVNAFSSKERADYNAVLEQWDSYFAVTDEMIADIEAGTPASMAKAWDILNVDLDTAWAELVESTSSLSAAVDKRSDVQRENADRTADQMKLKSAGKWRRRG